MLSRLKSTVKGVLGMQRAPAPAASRPEPAAARPAAAPAPRPAPAAAKPLEAAKPVEAPKPAAVAKPVEAPKPAAAPVAHAEAPKAEAPKAEAAKAAEPEAPKKLSMAAAAAAAAKAPAPKAVVHQADEDDDHDDDHGPKHAAPASSGGKPRAADTGSTDLEGYILRAKANNRDMATIVGGTGLNTAPDGTTFWGPVNNSSSRAKAAKLLLTIDQFECISCGTCVEQTDKVFYLPADGKATPIAQDGPMDLIEDAIEACPVTCIHWVSPDEAVERGLTSGMEEGA